MLYVGNKRWPRATLKRKEKRKWPKAKEKKKIYNKAKGLSKEEKERKHKVLKYAKGIRLKKKREM